MQQTRIQQGTSYYQAFISKYPDIKLLAIASEDEVLNLWKGLGYYSRARNLHRTAIYIYEELNGIFPSDYSSVRSLKGVGDYTAAAIMSFAYNEPYATIDGNVYRILSRIFGVAEPIDTSLGQKVFKRLADSLIDLKDPRSFNNAMMDFGALQCVPKIPDCNTCPFQEECVAYKTNLIKELPKKKNKSKIRNRYFYYFDIRIDQHFFLKKRNAEDIWQGLYDFLLIEKEQKTDIETLHIDLENLLQNKINTSEFTIEKNFNTKHLLSHQRISAEFFKIRIKKSDSAQLLESEMKFKGFQKIDMTDVSNYPVSSLVLKYLNSK